MEVMKHKAMKERTSKEPKKKGHWKNTTTPNKGLASFIFYFMLPLNNDTT